jgi:hypothetical protein
MIRMVARLRSLELPGLYVVATMRSEEIHRSVDYPELTELIDRTAHFIDLPRPENLFSAITSSARIVLQLGGLDLAGDIGIEHRAAERMLDAIDALGPRRTQRADQLPLLQNALRELWHKAARRWLNQPSEPFAIDSNDLTALPTIGASGGVPDLIACLNNTADNALIKAVATFDESVDRNDAQELLEVAFIRLEQPDDRGNSSRAFATIDDILMASGRRWPTGKADLQRALDVFVIRTILSRRESNFGDIYDVSHEAIIRNWKAYTGWLDNATRVRRTVARALEDIWEKRATPTLPSRFESGDLTPELSGKESASVISRDQSKTLEVVRPLRYLPTWRTRKNAKFSTSWLAKTKAVQQISRRVIPLVSKTLDAIRPTWHRLAWRTRKNAKFSTSWLATNKTVQQISRRVIPPVSKTLDAIRATWHRLARHTRRNAKFSTYWLATTIAPVLQRQLRSARQVVVESMAHRMFLDETIQQISTWFIDVIDKARYRHRWNTTKTFGAIVGFFGFVSASAISWDLFQLTKQMDLSYRSAALFLKGTYWQTLDRESGDVEFVNLINELLWYSKAFSYSVVKFVLAPTRKHLEANLRTIGNLDSLGRNRLNGLEYRELAAVQAKTATCVKNEDDNAVLTVESGEWGVQKVPQLGRYVAFVKEKEGNKRIGSGESFDWFDAPLGVWCLSTTGDSLLIWAGAETLPYIIPIQWNSYRHDSRVRWLPTARGSPRTLALPSDKEQNKKIVGAMSALYLQVSEAVGRPGLQSIIQTVDNDDRTGFVIARQGQPAVEISSTPGMWTPQGVFDEIPSSGWVSCLDDSGKDDTETVKKFVCASFEDPGTGMWYRLLLRSTRIERPLLDLDHPADVNDAVLRCSTTHPDQGLCSYELKLVGFGESSKPVELFGYSHFYSQTISAAAFQNGYLWLRRGGNGGDVIRFDFSSKRRLAAMQFFTGAKTEGNKLNERGN